ncbi:unnamed protein product [Gongylonema pulchrum]|uniref:PfkB domain-containing protein n=1 Tax=Gongylonema pulchrum TaxID=637853 RepID=A0A183EF15_9BILA|nr:unnamed protein product [Gongylonema pulchrum]
MDRNWEGPGANVIIAQGQMAIDWINWGKSRGRIIIGQEKQTDVQLVLEANPQYLFSVNELETHAKSRKLRKKKSIPG